MKQRETTVLLGILTLISFCMGHAALRSLTIQAPRNILSPTNEMHFSIRQRIVSHGHDPYESNESTTRRRVSRHAAS